MGGYWMSYAHPIHPYQRILIQGGPKWQHMNLDKLRLALTGD